MKCEHRQNDRYKTCGLDPLASGRTPCEYLIATKRCPVNDACEGECKSCVKAECSDG